MDKDLFFKNGYYVGKIEEMFDDLEVFEACIQEALDSFADLDPEVWHYNHAIINNQMFPSKIKPSEVEARKKLAANRKFTVFQQLYVGIPTMNIRMAFTRAANKFIKDLYPLQRKFQFQHDQQVTVLAQGDYINTHVDGGNPERLCGILTYLSNFSDYEKNDGGGELVLNSDIIIPPVKGTFVILDYTQHNLEHGVNKVKNDFKRFAHVNFVKKARDE